MKAPELQNLMKLLAKLPGFGPRSGRRAALYLLKNKETVMRPLAKILESTANTVQTCSLCYNLDTENPCFICTHPNRDPTLLCIVQEISDLWALERTAHFAGQYHVLGGNLSALEGISPETLNIPSLLKRVENQKVSEIILALNLTVEGQTTAYYLADCLKQFPIKLTALAHGIPLGGELDYLDDGTLATALHARRAVDAA